MVDTTNTLLLLQVSTRLLLWPIREAKVGSITMACQSRSWTTTASGMENEFCQRAGSTTAAPRRPSPTEPTAHTSGSSREASVYSTVAAWAASAFSSVPSSTWLSYESGKPRRRKWLQSFDTAKSWWTHSARLWSEPGKGHSEVPFGLSKEGRRHD